MKNLNYNLLNILLGVLASLFVSLFIIFFNALVGEFAESWVHLVLYLISLLSCIFTFGFGFSTLKERKAYELECERILKDESINNKRTEIDEDKSAKNAFVFFRSKALCFFSFVCISFITLGIGILIETNSKNQSLVNKKTEEEKLIQQLFDDYGLLKKQNDILNIKLDSLGNANNKLFDMFLELKNKIK